MNLPGAYRKLVAFPGNLMWKCVQDGHACTGDFSADHSAASTGSNPKDDVKRPRLGEDETICFDATEQTEFPRNPGNFCNSIELSFSLEPSCYATSCIRELMKN